jgi:uncharacterized membrane protein HdeD (DUF308 family)
MSMSQRNSIGRSLAARFDTLSGSWRGIAACGIAIVAIGAVCLMEQPTAPVNYAVAVAFGGLLLVGGVVAKRGSKEPSGCLVKLKRVRVRPCDIVDRNHR